MPENKLDQTKLEQIQKDLLNLKSNILHDIKNMDADNSAEGQGRSDSSVGHGMHIADAASEMYDREFSLNLASNDRELLQKIEESLKRIEGKIYGLCVRCKGPIPYARLKALPYAENCVKCQEELDNGRKPA
ncbi:MAG TPA: TraR/DksA C4-type zinc finger protein [Candidatus Omnitrophota bacterium]|nr:TraR/DksA C4-type zinc finger protein [Candidatus Omnitrophota bacterium]HSA30451.1 TraR/DksA C4-type zinc finger protein [Candidatus Omnitrophota bacterium]